MTEKTNLYHCTKGDSLIRILESKYFLYSYCLEEYCVHKENKIVLEKRAYAIVCFADLLENELPDHISQFHSDSYLMMDKKWAKNKRISPVIYFNINSLSNLAFLSINNRKKELSAFKNEYGIDKIDDILEKSIELIRPYFKLYRGKYFIKGTDEESNEEVEFFLEREWRSFPVVERYEHVYLDINDYKDPEKRNMYQKQLFEHGYCLKFDWDDILKIGCCRKKKREVIQAIQNTFGVDRKTARKKIEIIRKKLFK